MVTKSEYSLCELCRYKEECKELPSSISCSDMLKSEKNGTDE